MTPKRFLLFTYWPMLSNMTTSILKESEEGNIVSWALCTPNKIWVPLQRIREKRYWETLQPTMSTTDQAQGKSWTTWNDDAPMCLTSCITSTCQLLYPPLIRTFLILLVTGIPFPSRHHMLACWVQPSAASSVVLLHLPSFLF